MAVAAATRPGERAAGRVIRVGMLGSGFIGEFHTQGLRHVPDAAVVANYGRGDERREAFAERFDSRPVHLDRRPVRRSRRRARRRLAAQ